MLENQSPEMKTVVETFLVEEVTDLIYDNEKLDQWKNQVTELGLTGQTTLAEPKKSPVPFLYLKNGLKNIITTLCPVVVEIEKFDKTPIPLEILDLVALSKRENYFDRYIIRYDDKNPDPACIGIVSHWELHKKGTYSSVEGHNKNFRSKELAQKYINENGLKDLAEPYHGSWKDKHYLIGKWGDVKHSFEELKEMAKDRYIAQEGASLRSKIKEAQRDLDDLEIKAVEQFN